jgi:hypothetical protein
MADLNQLVEQIYSYFQQTYRLEGATAPPGGLFLAFEKIGTSVSPQDFKLSPEDSEFNAAKIQQHGSHIVDFVAELDEQGFIHPRGDVSATVEGQYRLLLSMAQPLGANAEAFLQVRGQAKQLMDEMQGDVSFDDFLPVQFTPQFWFNPDESANWTTYSTSSTAPPPPQQPPPPPTKIAPWQWRVVAPEARVQWSALQSAALQQAPTPALPVTHLAAPANLHLSAAVAPTPLALAVAAPVAHPAPALTAGLALHAGVAARIPRNDFRADMVRVHVGDVASPAATATPVMRNWKLRAPYRSVAVVESMQLPQATPSSDSFSVSFEYCLVNVARPWISPNFLLQPSWHIPGQAAASWASGKYQTVAQSFGYLPAKILVVKNLKITANWSQEDLTRIHGTAAAFGPFSLLNYQFNSGTLSAPGMQIIAWLCQVMPMLPPASDPAIGAG